jgi:signal transduction histidine kinase
VHRSPNGACLRQSDYHHGQLTASIAHEIKQLLAALITNAQAILRWLRPEPPDLDETRQAIGNIIKDGTRASDVLERVRTLVKKTPQ